jgi:hypothetical protein
MFSTTAVDDPAVTEEHLTIPSTCRREDNSRTAAAAWTAASTPAIPRNSSNPLIQNFKQINRPGYPLRACYSDSLNNVPK